MSGHVPADPTPADPAPADPVPGQHHLGPNVERFDDLVDSGLERFRGNPVLDRVFTTASHVGDFSLIWHTVNVLVGIRRREPRQMATFAILIGLESLVVNQGVKRLFRRARPTTAGDDRLGVRRPRTSSFPSGHASSATFAAVLLTRRTGQPVTALIYLAAATVATSRAYVRIHHASDVVAGVVTGGFLAALTRCLIRRIGHDDLR